METIFNNWHQEVPKDFSPQSRVWIYQANRLLHIQEALHVKSLLDDFVENWKSHGMPVKGYANIFFGQFVILMADETSATVGGCSTDSSVRLVKELEHQLGIQLLDRLSLAFVVNQKVQVLPISQIQYALQQNFLNGNTIYFNNLITNKQDWLHNWMIPLKDSWLYDRFLKSQVG